jgi:hypothetical protein
LKAKPRLRRYPRRTRPGCYASTAAPPPAKPAWTASGCCAPRRDPDRRRHRRRYKQLVHIECGWRDLKGAGELRPVFHHRKDRMRAHIQLCWLALLLIRVVENPAGDTWRLP